MAMRVEDIQELAEILAKSSLGRVEVSGEAWSVELERAAPAPPPPPAPVRPVAAPPAAAPAPEPMLVEAPVVGVFHEASPPLVNGAMVKLGDVLGSIEALALRNDVRSTETGEITQVHVEDGQPVEYGQPLFSIQRKDA